MAGVFGSELNIDGLIEMANKAQQAMNKVANSAEGAGKRISDVFKSISTQGIDATLQKLYGLQTAYSAIANTTVRDAGLKEIATNARTALDAVNKLIEGLSKAYGVQAPTSTTAQTKAEAADVAMINELYRQRIALIKEFYNYRNIGSKRELTEAESSAMSRANSKASVVSREIEKNKQRQDLSDKAIHAIIENERKLTVVIGQEALKQKDIEAKAQAEVTKAVETEIEKEKQAHLKALADQIKAEQEYAERVKKLKEARATAQQNKNQAYNTTVEGSLKFSDNAKSINRQQKAIEYLTQARAKLNLQTIEGQKQAQILSDRIRQHTENINRSKQSTEEYRNALRKLAQVRLDNYITSSPDRAIAYGRSTKSINDQIRAIQLLKKTRDSLNRGSFASEEAYRKKIQQINDEIKRQQKEVDKLQGKQKQLGNSQRSLMNISNQLQRRMALLFSVSAITGYINKLASVRGEFEMQQRSLQIILQNKDEANKIWQQTIDLAVKSPFRVKQLVTYTKQLAAYRIETDKLHDTTKRLADVSAGLGVDMQRLILAYGQVRAANFLRGTELRQFTEAGIPMLEELAKYFTELEGKAVSVGDVFGRVSKRLVAFSDVEAVLNRMTDEGGVFYKMQEQQADTLKGQLSNLQDSIDLMLNDMGKSHNSALQFAVQLMRTLVENWRIISPIVSFIATLIVAQLVKKGLRYVVAYAGQAVTAFKGVSQAIKGTQVAAAKFDNETKKMSKRNMWLILIQLVVSLGMAIYDATKNASELRMAMDEIEVEGIKDLEKSKERFEELADTIRDLTKSAKERDDALTSLKRTYDNILPSYMLEVDYLKNLTDGYTAANNALELFYETQAKKQKIELIEKEYAEEIQSDTDELAQSLIWGKVQGKDPYNPKTIAEYYKLDPKYMRTIVRQVIEDAKRGKVELSQIGQTIEQRLGAFMESGLDVEWLFGDSPSLYRWEEDIRDITKTLQRYREEIDGISGLGGKTLVDVGQREKAIEVSNAYEKQQKVVTRLSNAYQDYYKVREQSGQSELADNEQLKRYKDDVLKLYKELNLITPNDEEFNAYTQNLVTLNGEIASLSIKANENFIEGLRVDAYKGNKYIENLIEEINKKSSRFNSAEWYSAVYDMMYLLSEQFEVPLKAFDKLNIAGSTSISDLRKNVQSELERLIEQVNQFDSAWSGVLHATDDENSTKQLVQNSLGVTVDGIKEIRTVMIPMLTLFNQMLGNIRKGKTDGKNDIWTRRLSIIKELNKEYETLNKTFDGTTAKEKVLESYTDAVNELFKGLGITINNIDFTSLEELVSFIQGKLVPELKGENLQEALKIKAQLQVDIDKEAIETELDLLKERIDSIFDNYQLSKDLYSLGMPANFVKKAFGIEKIDLAKMAEMAEEMIGKNLWGATSSISALDSTEMQELRKDYSETQIDLAIQTHKRLQEEEDKHMAEMAKNLYNYIKNTADQIRAVEWSATAMIQYTKQQFAQGNITAQQYVQAITEIANETNDKIGKIESEEFKRSADYLAIMGDVSAYSKKHIDRLTESLKEFIKTNKEIDPEEMKEYQKSLEKLQKQQDKQKNSGFWNLFDDKKTTQEEVNEIAELERERIELNTQLETKIAEENKLLVEQQQLSEQLAGATDEDDKATFQSQIDSNAKALTENQNAQKGLTMGLQEVGSKMQGLTGGMNGTMGTIDKIVKEVDKYVRVTIQGFNDIKSLYETYGHDTDKGYWRDASKFMETSGKINERVTQSWEAFKNKDFASASMHAVGAIIEGIKGINELHDERLEEKIQKELELIDDLEHEYKKLEKAVKNAYSIDTLEKANDLAEENIQQRIDATERAIQAEKDKKDTDKERIEDMDREVEEYEEMLKELEEQRIQELGGFGSDEEYKDAAETFVDAWLEAFEETGNGLTGLEGQFDEFMRNVVKKQILMRAAEKFIQPILDKIDAMFAETSDAGGVVTTAEITDLLEFASLQLPLADKVFTELAESLKAFEFFDSEGETLTGLQKGIQGVTEETAQIIEAYLNSMRFYVADSNAKLTQLVAMQSNDDTPNPMLAQLKIIATQTTAIHTLLDSVIKGGHSEGGKGIKVFIS